MRRVWCYCRGPMWQAMKALHDGWVAPWHVMMAVPGSAHCTCTQIAPACPLLARCQGVAQWS